jgi:hypothetical protein
MGKLYFLGCTLVFIVTVSLPSVRGVQAIENTLLTAAVQEDPYFRKLQGLWSNLELSRDLDYWRAPEITPGSFLSVKPAAESVWVSNDRWPDGSDARRFGLDAIRLSGAQTDHEKALAVYRWVRRWMIYNNKKGSAIERLSHGTIDNPVVNQADKLLNVYGVHWCGGQARVVEQVWRALGYRAEKVIRGGHTIVGLHYRDYDGIERWHGLDVSHSAVAWDRSYRRLLSLDELSSRWYSFYYQYGLPGNGHLYFNDHRMELAFRIGEKLERLWGNLGKPYQDNAAQGRGMAERVPNSERGPYLPFTYGNGSWSYTPDLSRPGWEDGLAEPPEGTVPGMLQPVNTDQPATAIWHFRTPYIVSDAAVKIKLFRKSAEDVVRLHLSTDNGKTWKLLWACPEEIVGTKQLVIPVGQTFEVSEKGPAPPQDFNSPFGRYAYRIKLELIAKDKPEDCRVEAVSFETTVQLNSYSLPQLQPGKNNISVRGELAPETALQVIYRWDDAAGKGRRNVTLIEKTPYTYEIVAAGNKWEDCVAKAITIEVVPATGQGNRTLVKETVEKFQKLPPLSPVEETMGRWNGQPLQRNLPKAEDILSAATDSIKFKRALRGAVMLNSPLVFDALRTLAYQEEADNNKLLAFVGMYRANPERARPVLLDILSDRDGHRVSWSKGKDKQDVGWGREQSWCAGGTVIGYIAAEAGWMEFLPGLLRVLASKQCSPGWGSRYGTVRVIGRLGKGDKNAAEAIRAVLEHRLRKEHGDTLIVAALAAGQIGDPLAIPALRLYIADDYWPLKHNAALSLSILGDRSIIPRMREWLMVAFDENFRGYAAEALGNLKDRGSTAFLQAALKKEPFPWVRRKLEEALAAIKI